MAKQLPIYVVDAFTVNSLPFTGNSAGVCLLEYDDDISDEVKQQIASEMNLSETAFVSYGWTNGKKLSTAPDAQITRRTLRWFTPANEVPLCGHATLASAKVITGIQEKGCQTVSFESKFRGKLGAQIETNGLISLNFPSNPTHALNQDPKESPWLESILDKTGTPKGIVQDIQYSPGTKILLIRIKDELGPEGLRKVSPNFKALLNIDTGKFVHDIIVTVKGIAEGPDFFSRFIAPWDGIDEDPVTGLAHTVLTPYWNKELGRDGGVLKARQHSTRGGDLQCTLLGDRVKLCGNARLGLKGELFLN